MIPSGRAVPAPAAADDTLDATCVVYVVALAALRAGHLALLDDRERRRRDALARDEDKDRYTLATALLRLAVVRHTGADPTCLVVDRRCDRCGRWHGRPRLPGIGLHASISHSTGLVAVAVTGAGAVGVDVESNAIDDYERLAPLVCDDVEGHHLRSAGDFATCWTRKEAVLKALGDGLLRSPTSVVVTPPNAVPALLSVDGRDPPPCRLFDLPVIDDHAGAVAVLTATPIRMTVASGAALL